MVDRFGREISYLRLSVTERCDLRCRYCMPEGGVCEKELLTQDEMVWAVEAAAALGMRKLRITGGEPLVRPDILTIAGRCAAVPGIREVCLTTNGLGLGKLARPLREAGVDRVNVSLDTLDRAKYAYMTRRDRLEDALAGLEAALAAGFRQVKLNAVLIGGFNDDEIPALAELTRRRPVDVRFIELMPMGGGFPPGAYLPCGAVLERLPQLAPEGVQGTARLYRLPGALGRVGLISPVSAHFCARCDRLRLTADGMLKPCLHGAEEHCVKGLDRAGMGAAVGRAGRATPACHAPLSGARPSAAGRAMHRIGG